MNNDIVFLDCNAYWHSYFIRHAIQFNKFILFIYLKASETTDKTLSPTISRDKIKMKRKHRFDKRKLTRISTMKYQFGFTFSLFCHPLCLSDVFVFDTIYITFSHTDLVPLSYFYFFLIFLSYLTQYLFLGNQITQLA